MHSKMSVRATFLALASTLPFAAYAIADTAKQIDIPAGSLSQALLQVSKEYAVDLVYRPEQVTGLITKGVHGEFTTEQAVSRLLEGTALQVSTDTSGAMFIAAPLRSDASAPSSSGATKASPDSADTKDSSKSFWSRFRLAQGDTRAENGSETEDSAGNGGTRNGAQRVEIEEVVVNIPEVLVKGSKSLNTDIRRSRDDAQPYTVFERKTIERSGATNVEDFLKQRLTMNAQNDSYSQTGGVAGSQSQINLRGIGTNQTLILIDGHRSLGTIGIFASPLQADLNSIPIGAVERIEVLPTTASGIYGGAATGGVVNVVLRRDYSGVEVKLDYENTFTSDAAARRIDFGSGFNLEGGRTNIMISGSYLDQNPLLNGERNFTSEYRRRVYQNDPQFYADDIFPPAGATPNIHSADGSPLFGPGTPSFTSVPVGYTGGGGLAPFQARAGVYNFDLAPTGDVFGANRSLIANPTNKALMVTVRREFTDWLRAYVDVSASNNVSRFQLSNFFTTYFVSGTAPNNPFGTDIFVTAPSSTGDGDLTVKTTARQAVGGVIVSLPHEWQLDVDYTYQKGTWRGTDAPFNSYAESALVFDGTIDVLRGTPFRLDSTFLQPLYWLRRDSTLKDSALRASGPVFSLPAGEAILSGLVEYRDEAFGDGIQIFDNTKLLLPSRGQRVTSAYLETRIPLFSERNAKPFLRSLEVQLAGRWDQYDVTGATGGVGLGPTGPTQPIARPKNHTTSTDPTIALRYQPVRDVVVRASYGTGFLPPSMDQLLTGTPSNSNRTERDPLRGNARIGNVLLTSGGNTGLTPEQSESRSAGIVFEPTSLPGFRLSLDWTLIKKTENISQLSVQQFVDNEALFPSRVTRNTDPTSFGGFSVGPITAIDITSINTSRQQVQAYDLAVDYNFRTQSFGEFTLFALGTSKTRYKAQFLPTSDVLESEGPIKANAGVSWGLRSLTLAWNTRYYASSPLGDPTSSDYNQRVAMQGGTRLPSQTYHDFFASYRFGNGGNSLGWANGVLSDLELQFGVRNVFNKAPPFNVNNGALFYDLKGDARLASYYLTVKTSF